MKTKVEFIQIEKVVIGDEVNLIIEDDCFLNVPENSFPTLKLLKGTVVIKLEGIK